MDHSKCSVNKSIKRHLQGRGLNWCAANKHTCWDIHLFVTKVEVIQFLHILKFREV